MADKYIYNNNGVKTEKEALVISTGAGDAGKIVALSSDGKLDDTVMPVGLGLDTLNIVASEALNAGDLVNVFDDAGTPKIRKADAATNKEAHGFVKASVSAGASGTVYFDGTISGLTGLTAGTRYYLSSTTAGATTATPPTTSGFIVQYVGFAISSTELSFEPDDKIVLA